MKEKTRTILYGTFVSIMVLALGIGYANITTELKIEGEGDAKEQEGVYIANVEYLTDNGADTDNSKINYSLGTMLDSKIVLGSSSTSSITYQVTIKNNTDREQVFIGITKDETNEEAYNNTSIQPNVATAGGVTGLEEYVSTVAPGEYITFPVTYAYAGIDTSNPELQGKINFRFREKPILELSNNEEPYTLENIKAGDVNEYTFTVNNYNESYTNGVPLTYNFVTTLTEGSPLTAKIYDSEGNEVTEDISMAGDNTQVEHTYTLKLIWDSSLESTEYEGKSYTCTVDVTAIPDTEVDADLADYGDYKIEQGFEIEITTCSHTWQDGVCTICGKVCEHEEYGEWNTATTATCAEQGTEKRTCTACGYEETRRTGYSRFHDISGESCYICGLNFPQLIDGMDLVIWDEYGNEISPSSYEEWFDYGKQVEGVDGTSNWANAVTEDGSYWVWIPRFEYKITSQPTDTSGAGTIDIRFIPTTTNSNTPGYATSTDVNQIVNGVEVLSAGITVSSDGYIIHPAFTSDPDIGGWDSELPGIWVAKYEMSMETGYSPTETTNSTIGNVATNDEIKMVSKPGVTSWRYINISNAYENSLNYAKAYGSHLMKNSEWGAVTYLTHSPYGRNGNAVTSNNSYYTAGSEYANATTNVEQSSTGNATGVYDLSGGGFEFVAAFNNAYASSDDLASNFYSPYFYGSASGNNMGDFGVTLGGSTRYLTAYSNSSSTFQASDYSEYKSLATEGNIASITGDALAEVLTGAGTNWFGWMSNFMSVDKGFLMRGSDRIEDWLGGIFFSEYYDGWIGEESGFRVCLTTSDCDHSTSNSSLGLGIDSDTLVQLEPHYHYCDCNGTVTEYYGFYVLGGGDYCSRCSYGSVISETLLVEFEDGCWGFACLKCETFTLGPTEFIDYDEKGWEFVYYEIPRF